MTFKAIKIWLATWRDNEIVGELGQMMLLHIYKRGTREIRYKIIVLKGVRIRIGHPISHNLVP
jgi:hypothetical protein